uniref:Fatty acid desaturase domain-containing protein n=1 Tax=Fibrocapsa japonica TaxID=94617 RepID=A0A7S2V6J1_9STRA|mmetsp:Transcript_8809/g.13559  ORF Transcript_8809/g.13559 Transcript_8809/m.13559 type:complete len:476 (+) Transcript_8809:85-1512(+)
MVSRLSLIVVSCVLLFYPSHSFNLGFSKLGSRTSTLPRSPAIALPVENDQLIAQPKQTDNSWVQNLDYDAFAKDVTELGKQLQADSGEEDVRHLNKILRWRNLAAVVGVATMWATPNPLTIAALSTWTYASWTMIAHHTCHGGYNRVDAGKYNSRGFALRTIQRRISDWCDWMYPEAWNVEHNRLHHYHLGEPKDPDLVERNLDFLRQRKSPMFMKYALVAGLIPVWKWFYYAPNTFKELQIQERRINKEPLPEKFDPLKAATFRTMLFPRDDGERALKEVLKPVQFFKKVLGPFLVSRFILLPAPLLAIPGMGQALFTNAIVNLVLAELLTNIHAFITIVTNHAGEDLYTFGDEVKPKTGSFYVRQIVSSANYAAGTDAVDFSHGWLNYQIEHHVWPDLSMLAYQKGAPQLKAICEKHGVPYIQESVWTRLRKTVDIMVGKTSMIPFPTELEPAKDKATKGVTWKSTNGAIDDE